MDSSVSGKIKRMVSGALSHSLVGFRKLPAVTKDKTRELRMVSFSGRKAYDTFTLLLILLFVPKICMFETCIRRYYMYASLKNINRC